MGVPNYPKDMTSEWNRLKRDVKNAFTSANLRVGMTKIGASIIEITGELVMNAGAKLIAKYANGVSAFKVGKQSGNVEEIIFKRADGSFVFWQWGDSVTGDGFWGFYDKQGNIILGEDAASGKGIARPWLPYNWVPTAEVINPATRVTSSTFTAVHTVCGVMQHPRLEVYITRLTVGGDVGQWRLRDPTSGTVLFTSGNFGASDYETIQADHVDYSFNKQFKYDIEVRRVSGTSTGVGVTPLYIVGRQT